MAITLPFPLTVREMRVLQEFRRMGTDALSRETIQAIRHPAAGADATPGLVAKGYLAVEGDSSMYTLTAPAKEFLAIDAKPEFESGSSDAEEPAE